MKIFKNPDLLPIGNGGGTCKNIDQVKRLLKTSIGAVEIGSMTKLSRDGNTGNTFHEGRGYTLNSLGMPNNGEEWYKEHLPEMIEAIHGANKSAIVNVAGFNTDEFSSLTRTAFGAGADYVVLNCGCPNVWDNGKQKGILTFDLQGMKETISVTIASNPVESRSGRVGVKLSPITDPLYMEKLAEYLNILANNHLTIAHSTGYIGFVTSINTIPNCYDEGEVGVSVISNGLAGMAGEAVLPMALGQVKQLRKLLDPGIKIIGIGGVRHGSHVERFMKAGADFVQITSSYYARNEDPGVLEQIAAEWMTLKE